MVHTVLRVIAALLLMLPAFAAADPITLKLSFFSSDRTVAYQTAIKPFVDAVNIEGRDIIRIDVYPSGTLGRVQKDLPQQVLDGTADIAFIIPGQNPERFVDNSVMELAGLFRDVREATLTYTRLIAADALAGYREFYVIGAYATQPEIINTRSPVRTLDDLKGLKIRVNNPMQAAALNELGVLPRILAFNETGPALNSGAIDGATVPPAQLFDVGIGRFTGNHYLLATSVAPLTLLMNRSVYDHLPPDARDIIRKHSGEWIASRFINAYQVIDKKNLADITSDPRRAVVSPTPADLQSAQQKFEHVIQAWAARGPHNQDLLNTTRSILAKLRQTETEADHTRGSQD
ncbi:MAG TPA: TRAP transporter substrate-binding protein DctP [Pseudolabrys sp.]|nr:TRAP transporter substrate-binding protein DctP [Pseudolabrys sp.]